MLIVVKVHSTLVAVGDASRTLISLILHEPVDSILLGWAGCLHSLLAYLRDEGGWSATKRDIKGIKLWWLRTGGRRRRIGR